MKYRAKPVEVGAVPAGNLLAPEAVREFPDWLTDAVLADRVRVNRGTVRVAAYEEGQEATYAVAGDWLVFVRDRVWVMTDADFRGLYTPLEEAA